MNLQELQAELGYEVVIAETTDNEQDFLDQSDNDFEPNNDNLTEEEKDFIENTEINQELAEKAARMRRLAAKLKDGYNKSQLNKEAFLLEIRAGIVKFTKYPELIYGETNCPYLIDVPNRKIGKTTEESKALFLEYQVNYNSY